MQKQVVILFGQPGAGKGTQAEILSGKTGYYHFESSKIIEACFQNESPEKVFEIEGQNYKVADEKIRWETGLLNSPPFVVNLMAEKIKATMVASPRIRVNLCTPGKKALLAGKISGINPLPMALKNLSGMIIVPVPAVTSCSAPRKPNQPARVATKDGILT